MTVHGNMGRFSGLAALFFAVTGNVSPGVWLRQDYEDAVVVERSEAIVEGGIKPDSIRKVDYPDRSHVFHATLIVGEVHRGKVEGMEIPIIIHYGLSPQVTGTGSVELWDSGNSVVSTEPILKDIRKDTLWFLRRRKGSLGDEPSTGNFGIVDPEDVKSTSIRSYLLAYLASDPEKAVRKEIAGRPELELRARTYFAHREILRIAAWTDVNAKCDKLIEYLLQRHYWNGKEEAADALIRVGGPAGLALRKIFEDQKHLEFREDVIRIWGDMKYGPAVKLLTMTLRGQKGYWEDQDLDKNWWNNFSKPELNRERRANYGVLFQSIIALGKIGDPKAREALELTRTQWADPRFGFDQIFKECESALELLNK